MAAQYSPSAYQPARIPDLPAATKRSWVFRFGNSRLPWGHTEDIVPHSMLSHTSPAGLRDVERYEQALATGEEKQEAYELLDYHQVIDHERYRHASLSKRSLFWFYLWGGAFCFLGDVDFLSYRLASPGRRRSRRIYKRISKYCSRNSTLVFGSSPRLLGHRLSSRSQVHQLGRSPFQRPAVGVQPPHRHGHDLRLRQYGRVQTQRHHR